MTTIEDLLNIYEKYRQPKFSAWVAEEFKRQKKYYYYHISRNVTFVLVLLEFLYSAIENQFTWVEFPGYAGVVVVYLKTRSISKIHFMIWWVILGFILYKQLNIPLWIVFRVYCHGF